MGVWERYKSIRAERLAEEANERENHHNHRAERYLKLSQKSRGTAIILALLFGPLGLLYVSPAAAILLAIVAIIGAVTVVVPVGVWILSIGLADHYAYKHNLKQEALMGVVSPGSVREKKENPRMLVWIVGMIASLFFATASSDPNSWVSVAGSVFFILFFVAMVAEMVMGWLKR